MEKESYTRTEIYEMLWVEATTKVAQLLGMSDVGLGKWCKSYGVPKPPKGYWAKRHNGVEVPKRPPMEPWWNDHEPSIRVNAIDKARILARANLEKTEEPVWEVYSGNKFDDAIVKTFENYSAENVSKYGRASSKQGFSLDISPKSVMRVKRILQTLISELKKRGYETFNGSRYSGPMVTGFMKDGEKYSISIYEGSSRLEVPIKKKKTWSHNGETHSYYETIEFGTVNKLELNLRHHDIYDRKVIKDTTKASLESQLGKTLVIFNEYAVEAKAVRAERERKELEQQRLQKLREDRAWAKKVKEWKLEQLIEVSQVWDQLQSIKRFINEVESNTKIHQANPDYQDWIVWAKNQLDQMDAIKRAEEGEPLPGQDEPDRRDFKIANDDYDDYEDD